MPDAESPVVPKQEHSREPSLSSIESSPDIEGEGEGAIDVHEHDAPLPNAPVQKRKGGRKPIYATSEERKQRNRQAQAAFRERRTEYIKQLEATIKQQDEQLHNLQQSHRSAADECLMLRYKNSLLERILLEKGIDVQAELKKKEISTTGKIAPTLPHPSPVHRPPLGGRHPFPHAHRSSSGGSAYLARPAPGVLPNNRSPQLPPAARSSSQDSSPTAASSASAAARSPSRYGFSAAAAAAAALAARVAAATQCLLPASPGRLLHPRLGPRFTSHSSAPAPARDAARAARGRCAPAPPLAVAVPHTYRATGAGVRRLRHARRRRARGRRPGLGGQRVRAPSPGARARATLPGRAHVRARALRPGGRGPAGGPAPGDRAAGRGAARRGGRAGHERRRRRLRPLRPHARRRPLRPLRQHALPHPLLLPGELHAQVSARAAPRVATIGGWGGHGRRMGSGGVLRIRARAAKSVAVTWLRVDQLGREMYMEKLGAEVYIVLIKSGIMHCGWLMVPCKSRPHVV